VTATVTNTNRLAGLALRAGAVAMAAAWAARAATGEAGPPLGLASEGLSGAAASITEWAIFLALVVSAAMATTRRARFGMLGIGLTAALVDAALLWAGPPSALLAPFCHAARWLAPLAFVVLAAPRAGTTSTATARTMLAVAAAATFAGHGIEAFEAPPHFVAYLQCACRIVTGDSCRDEVAQTLLIGIGIADLTVAALVLTGRRGTGPALVWMVIWGAATAAVRSVHGGLEAWTLTAERLPNAMVPLALLAMRKPPTAAA
jgi:hypothetical protein